MKTALHILIAITATTLSFAETQVFTGFITEFNGPDQLNLAPELTVVAVDLNGDEDRLIDGVLFQTDNNAISNVQVTAANSITDWAQRPTYSGTDQVSADNLEMVMQDIRWAESPATLNLDIGGLTPGTAYRLQLLVNEGSDRDRHWDIAIEGELAVDDFTSMGDGVWTINNGFCYETTFTLPTGDTELNVLFAEDIGGQAAQGSDQNPLLQAFILSRVYYSETPDDLLLDRQGFFSNQTEEIGNLSTIDELLTANHLYSLTDDYGDNALFRVSDDQLEMSVLHDFTQDAIGTSYDIRLQTTDADTPSRFLEKDFTLTLQAPSAPTNIIMSVDSVVRGTIPDTPFCSLTTEDGNAYDAFQYTLISGDSDTDNGLLEIVDDQLALKTVLPSEQSNLYFRIRSADLTGLYFEKALSLAVVNPGLRINEIMASNATGLLDGDGDSSDWIELHNTLSNVATLSGWYLTDDPDDLTKWGFREGQVDPNGFITIFASGKNDGALHTNFALSSSGGYVALVLPDGATVASELNYPESYPDVSYGLDSSGSTAGFLQTASPGEANGSVAADVVNTVTFSQKRGFYAEAFTLTLAADLPDSIIHYTTNGDTPTASTGSIYGGPISVAPETSPLTRGTRRIRAIALNSAAAVSPVATHTYVWVNGTSDPLATGVVGQSSFEPAIAEDPQYADEMDIGLLALPVVSIVKPEGIGAVEEATSVELISNDGSEDGFQINCGIKAVGGNSINSPKNNFRCYFRGEYGASKLRYPLFEDHPYTEGASEEFDVIQLRGGSHDNFFWMAKPSNPPITLRHGDAQYVRNRWISDVEMLMGHTSLHGRFAHCYLNGVYHGLYQIHERPMHNYMDKYFGGDSEDYHFTNCATSGSDHGDGWLATWNKVKAAAAAGGQESKEWINWESLADNQLLNYYSGNDWDWKPTQNWMAAGPKNSGEGGWRFFNWDRDVMCYDTAANNLDKDAPDGVFQDLMLDDDFAVYFRDRIYKHCFHDGLLAAGNLEASHNYRMNEIFEAIVPETARWQPDEATNLPWDRNEEWLAEWDYMRDVYFQQRTAALLEQLENNGWYPIDAPEFTPRGGTVPAGTIPSISAESGTLYITTDSSDPRLPGGAVNPTAIEVNTGTVEQSLISKGATWKYLDDGSDQGTAWRETAFSDASWASGPAQLGYGDGDETTVVSYGDVSTNKHITTYFRRTFNVADAAAISGINIELLRDDGAVVYLNGTAIWWEGMTEEAEINYQTTSPNGSGGTDESTFKYKDDVSPLLLNEGINVVAVEIHQYSVDSSDISFDFALSVSRASNADQFTINELTQLNARILNGDEWSPINSLLYTVEEHDPIVNSITISEIHYNPSGSDDTEFIEIKNLSTNTVDLSLVEISNAASFTFPTDSSVAPGEHIVVVEDAVAFSNYYQTATSPWYYPDIAVAGQWTGALGNGGESIELLHPNGESILAVSYTDGGMWPERADGDGPSAELKTPTDVPTNYAERNLYLNQGLNWRDSSELHGSPGRDGTGPGPVLINEILTHSATTPDWIELYNESSSPVDIGGWCLSDSSEDPFKYTFPTNTVIAAEGFLTLDEQIFNNLNSPGVSSIFALSSLGEEVQLQDSVLRVASHRQFDAVDPDVTFGRHVRSDGLIDFPAQRAATFAAANAYPAVGPVVISEVMYNPLSGIEFVELINTSGAAVQLFDPVYPNNTWSLSGAIDYVFPTGAVIEADGILLVTQSTPDDFRATNTVDPEIPIYGPWSGQLNNAGEELLLTHPRTPVDGTVPRVVADRVYYLPTSPWPTRPDGSGPSLIRKALYLYGNDPANWDNSTQRGGSPGAADSSQTLEHIRLQPSYTLQNGRIEWPAIIGETYAVQFSQIIDTPTWTTLYTHTAATQLESFLDPDFLNHTTGFYRVIWLP